MTAADIAPYRLLNQQISATAFTQAGELLAWFGAMQAQEYALAKWAIGLRLPHLQDEDIEKNFTDGIILRTHILRPTWHFVPAKDIRWLLLLTTPRVHIANAFMYRKLELNSTIFNQCHDILIQELQGSKQLTRSVLNATFKQKGIIANGLRLSYIMMQAELEGVICSGARQGNQFTYALLEERVPSVSALTKEEALAELTKRYFKSRGPATVKDFSIWSGLTITEARKGITLAASCFVREKINQEDYYFAATMVTEQKLLQHIYLLPIYDEFIMGYINRDAILSFKQSLSPTPAFLYNNTIVRAGQITGTWKRTIHKNAIDIAYHLFKPFGTEELNTFNQAVAHFAWFTGRPVNLTEHSQ